MAAKLRSAVGRAARRIVSENLLILLRGPRPTTAAEADLLAKKADDAAKKGWVIQFTRRLIQEQKKTYESPDRVPWFAAMAFVTLFMSGYEAGRAQGILMYELQKPEGSN